MFLVKYIKAIGYIFLSVFIITFILNTFYYFDFIGKNLFNVLEILSIIISMFIGGFYIGKNSNNKGYLQGLKLSGMIIPILIIVNYLIFKNIFKLKIIVFYLIIVSSLVLGSVIGINKKESMLNAVTI